MTRPAEGAEPILSPESERVSEAAQAEAVQAMFNSIAPRYDLLNHVLSVNVDRLWWRRAAGEFQAILRNPQARILDLCCGTGDMTLALLRFRPRNSQPIQALDFAEAMLAHARKKFSARGISADRVNTIQADALHMPLADGSVDLLTSAFGFRNLANYEAGLREIHRVLRPGASVGILDFSEPQGWLGGAYGFYFHRVLPRIGRVISGASYEYLPRSVSRFPLPAEMVAMMRSCGFGQPTWTPYTLGIAGLYRAVKA